MLVYMMSSRSLLGAPVSEFRLYGSASVSVAACMHTDIHRCMLCVNIYIYSIQHILNSGKHT